MNIEALRKALDRSFVMGQDYWADAESESYSASRRSDVTRQKFNTMRDEICEAITDKLAEKDTLLWHALEALESFIGIVSDSRGVAGYHLNGNTAEWDEFYEVDAARNTIAAIRKHLEAEND